METVKAILLELARSGALVLYLHFMVRPLGVRLLGRVEALAKKLGLTAEEKRAGEQEADAETPDVPGGLGPAALKLLGGAKEINP